MDENGIIKGQNLVEVQVYVGEAGSCGLKRFFAILAKLRMARSFT